MTTKGFIIMLIIALGLFSNKGFAQNTKTGDGKNDRKPAVAGTFYSNDSIELKKNLKQFFEEAVPPKNEGVLRAVMVPHAGYVFSGQVAASGFKQIDPNKQYKNIFIIGSSHTSRFEGASVYADGSFATPLGSVPVDTAVAMALMNSEKLFHSNKAVHDDEHSLEVELPLLQYRLKNPFSIVPIIIGGQSVENCRKLAKALQPWFTEDNLFVISTDFSHYPNAVDARAIDKITADAIMENDAERLLSVLDTNERKGIAGLVTSLCGWTSVLTMLYLTENDSSFKFVHLQYMNSSESPHGDTSRVVGYNAIAVYAPKSPAVPEFTLSEMDKKQLVLLANFTINNFVQRKHIEAIDTTGFSPALHQHCGAFVTLKAEGKLRGCIGRFTADEPLYEVVQQMAISSATQDYRFSPVTKEELSGIDIEISVLSPLQKITSVDEIQLGVHGIYMTKNGQSGTFLPQVATDTGWSLEEFLGHCARDKAGIGWDGWKSAELYIYSAIVFGPSEYE